MKFLHGRVFSRSLSNLLVRSHGPDLVKLDKKVWHEILLRVDPNCIFECILVNKEWFEVITDPEFRRSYNERWKNKSDKVIGFFKSGARLPFRLLATTKLGDIVNETKLPAGLGNFIAKSFSGDGLILSGIPPSTFFVSDLTTGSVLLRLPPPPERFDNPTVAILSSYSEDSRFTVILAETETETETDDVRDYENETLNIQTFSSSTERWEQSTRTCSMYFKLFREPGVVTGNGVVYFRGTTTNDFGCVAVYDTNRTDENEDVGLIFQPGLMQFSAVVNRNVFHAYYGVAGDGSLRSATRRAYTNEDWKTGMISVYGLDEDGTDWKLLFMADPALIWRENSALLTPIFTIRPRSSFDFVSFAPGRSDSVYLRLKNEVFVYSHDSLKLELYGPKYCYADTRCLLPVTVTESGAWPSSPPSRLSRSP